MATLTIRQLDEKTKTRIRVRAAHHGRSMEEEAREILRSALRASPAVTENLSEAIRKRFAEFGGLGSGFRERGSAPVCPHRCSSALARQANKPRRCADRRDCSTQRSAAGDA